MELNQIIKARNKEFEITIPEEPFKDDKLGRKEYAEVLTDVVESFVGGAVVALNGAWGTGKTTFIKMWSQHLKNKEFPVVYYNAWEDDICNEPLMSMLRGLKLLDKEDGLDKVLKTGAKVLVGALSGALTAAAGIFGDVAKGAVEGGMKQLEDSVYESLKDDDDRLMLLQSFKDSLTNYMTGVCDKGKPLVYLVDELDRCNPTFAVKVLERIKHLFDVPNIVFVLSIDKKQLACSVKGFYGSNEIDADEYLRRFIDYDYYLPEPKADQFCDYLFDYYDFNAFLNNTFRLGDDFFGNNSNKAKADKNDLLIMAKTLVGHKHLSLRQIERVFATARIGLCSMPIKSEILPELFFFLSYLKVCEQDMFDRIASFSYGLQGFAKAMEQLIAPEKLIPNSQEWKLFHSLMVIALQCYYEGYKDFIFSTRKQTIDLYRDDKLVVGFDAFNTDTVLRGLRLCQINDIGYDISFITKRLKLFEQITKLP